LKDAQYLQKLREDAKESIAFFSNQNKPERERCVVRAFFRCLGVSFLEKDLLINQPEPIDVAALGGRFQVTEVLPPGSRRHQEYRERFEKLNKVSSIEELFEPGQNSKPVPWGNVVALVLERLSHKTAHADIDSLVYIDLGQTFFDVRSAKPGFSEIAKLGWRSVSVVHIPYSVVMSATNNAPSFLTSLVGSPRNAWTKPEGWFEPQT
jgi:hypothetical protein